MPGYLEVVVTLLEWFLFGCAGVAIVRAIGVGRIGRWLRLDVRDGDS